MLSETKNTLGVLIERGHVIVMVETTSKLSFQTLENIFRVDILIPENVQ